MLVVVTTASVVASAGPAAADVGGDPSAEAVALAEAARTGHRVEVVEEDTETETVFANPDGTLTSAVTQLPTRFREADGDLVPVDMGLAAAGGRLVPAASATDVSFSATGSGVLADLATAGGSSFGLKLTTGLDAPTVTDAGATYPVSGADPATVRVAATSEGFSAHVVLPSAPGSAPTYLFPLQLDGLHAALEHNQLVLTSDAGTTVATSAPLQMWDARVDAAGDPNHVVPVDADLVPTAGGGTSLRLQPSMGYLTDPDTTYPVVVDPTVSSVSRHSDNMVYSASPDTSYGGDYRAFVGTQDGTNKYRSFERFNIDAYLGKNIRSASLSMFQYSSTTCSNAITNVFATFPPVAAGMTWNNQPAGIGGARWSTPVSANSGFNATCPAATKTIDVTGLMNGYTTGALDSGLAGSGADDDTKSHVATIELRANDEANTTGDKRFCSMNWDSAPPGTICNSSSKMPTLALTYDADLGDKGSYSTTDHRLNDRSTLKVNNDNGNAVVKADDVSINSLGQDLTVSRYYNSQSDDAGAFGPKWSLSVGPDVRLRKQSEYRYDYIAASGAVYDGYVRTSTTVSSDPANAYNQFYRPQGGVGADLQDNSDGTFTMTVHKSRTTYVFKKVDTSSNDLYLFTATDRSGNILHYNYVSGTHQLSTVVDQDGHSLSVTYTSGVITSITDANGPSTRAWAYGYTGGRLTSYTDPESNVVNYGWDTTADPQVTTITDANNQSGTHPTATITPVAAQVTAVRYATATSSVGFDFAYNTTASSRCKDGDTSSTNVNSSDTTKGATTYCFRDRGQSGDLMTHRTVDGNGNRRSMSFSADSQPTAFTGAGTDSGAKSGSTVATYGGTGLKDQLNTVSDPTDAGATGGTSTTLTYSTPSTKAGYKYLPSAKLDGNGVCTAYAYDSTGRLTDAYVDPDDACSGQTDGSHYHQELNADGTVMWSYTPTGGSAVGDRTDYKYWATTDTGYVTGTTGQVKTITKPSGSCTGTRTLCTSFTYDGLARIHTMTDGRGKVTTYAYDKLDRVTHVLLDGTSTCSTGAGTCFTYAYDAEGNLTQRVDAQGTTDFTYDRLNRQRNITTPDTSVVAYTYNDDGKLTQLDTTVAGGATKTVAYTYDAGDQPLTATDQNGIINLGHSSDNEENYVKFPTTPNVTVDRTFTNAGRPSAITVQDTGASAGDLPDWQYNYQKSSADTNEVQQITVSGSTSAINQVVNYGYNTSGAFNSADAVTGTDYTYTYNGATDVKSENVAGATTYYGYDEAGQVCWQGTTNGTQLAQACPATPTGDTTINRDTAGNDLGTTATPLAYNANNQVSSIDTRAQDYLDQGNDLRVTTAPSTTLVNSSLGVVARTTTAGTTYYTRSPSGKILAEYGASGTYYFVTNAQGSVTTLINGTGGHAAYYRYSPYGNPTIVEDDTTTAGAANPWRYVGGYYDIEGDGYTKLGARYTDNHSHFNQPDPKPGTITNPATTLTYAYGGGDPMNRQDPNGRDSFETNVSQFESGYLVGAVFGTELTIAAEGAGLLALAPVAAPFLLIGGAAIAGGIEAANYL
jgi:RHS repeat-associated protein